MGHTSGYCSCANHYSSSGGSTTVCYDPPIEASFNPGTAGLDGIVFGSHNPNVTYGTGDTFEEPIYLYEEEGNCDGNNCTPPLYWAQSQSWSGNSSSTELLEILNTFSFDSVPLTDAQKQWIINHDNIVEIDLLLDFLAENNNSTEAKEFSKEIINSGIDNTQVTTFPFVKYPPNSNYEIHYPKLTEYLKNQLPKVSDIPLIVDTIKYLTGLSETQIKEDLKWGKGPTIHITQLDDFGTTTNDKTAGYFEPREPNVLHLDIDYVNKLENGTATQYEKDAFLFYLGTTILHEYVHYGDFQDGVDYPGEEGKLFEILVYGENVGSENAALILNGE